MKIWNTLPRLAVGEQPKGSGRACIMQALSIGNGDTIVTDTPVCTHPVLARVAMLVNDTICTRRHGDLLCSDCSAIMYGYEPLLVGTEAPEDELQAKRLAVAMAVATRRIVEPVLSESDRHVSSRAYDAAQAWLDAETDDERTTAYSAYSAYAVYYSVAAPATSAAPATYAYYSAYAAAAAAYAYHSAYSDSPAGDSYDTYAYNTHAANAAGAAAVVCVHSGASAPSQVLDLMIDTYYDFMGRTKPAVGDEHYVDLRKVMAGAGVSA